MIQNTPSLPDAIDLAARLNEVLITRQLMHHIAETYGVEVIVGPHSVTVRKHGNSIVLKGAITPQALRNGWDYVLRS